MREPDPPPGHDEDPGGDDLVQRGLGPVLPAGQPDQGVRVGLGERRRDQQQAARGGRECLEAPPRRRHHGGGQREAVRRPSGLVTKGPPDLEGEVRVAPGCPVDPEELRTRETYPGTQAQELEHRTHRQGSHDDLAHRPGGHGVHEGEPRIPGVGPDRGEDHDRDVHEAPERVGDRCRRGSVQPLGVVDRDHERRIDLGDGPEKGHQPDGDGARLGGLSFGVGTQQGDIERPALRSRQRRPCAVVQGRHEVTERGVRESRLRACRRRFEHPPPACPGSVDGGAPQRGLARAGRADEERRGRPPGPVVQLRHRAPPARGRVR